jgi:hypothetical protein
MFFHFLSYRQQLCHPNSLHNTIFTTYISRKSTLLSVAGAKNAKTGANPQTPLQNPPQIKKTGITIVMPEMKINHIKVLLLPQGFCSRYLKYGYLSSVNLRG